MNMARGLDQLYQTTAEEISTVLDRCLPAAYGHAIIRAEMSGNGGDLTCFYSIPDHPDKAFQLLDNDALGDMYLIFTLLHKAMQDRAEGWSTAVLVINDEGGYFIELSSECPQADQSHFDASREPSYDWVDNYIPCLTTVE